MTITAEQITYRIVFTWEGGAKFLGKESWDSLQEAHDAAVSWLLEQPRIVQTTVQCWRDGKYSHTMMRSYRKEH